MSDCTHVSQASTAPAPAALRLNQHLASDPFIADWLLRVKLGSATHPHNDIVDQYCDPSLPSSPAYSRSSPEQRLQAVRDAIEVFQGQLGKEAAKFCVLSSRPWLPTLTHPRS
jgi:hypothetical protein